MHDELMRLRAQQQAAQHAQQRPATQALTPQHAPKTKNPLKPAS
jgi:hypothetical protein